MKNLVIVESPAKSSTIEKYLGKDYKVMASYGHVRDLPKSRMGIDTEHDFEPEYIIPTKSKKNLNTIKKAAKDAELVLLATDLDREGEAIAWHIAHEIDNGNVKRITFSEITKDAILEAVKNPGSLNENLFNAQQARRVFDRLVGYSLSPLLWKKVRRGLSAGRVQSVAVKIIVDREREIEAFKPQEYWEISAELEKGSNKYLAHLIKKDGKPIEVKDEKTAKEIESDIKKETFTVSDINKREVKKSPAPPFITSTLQQESARKLHFSTKKTMVLAQQLYEGIDTGNGREGLITYMRTDSLNISNQAKAQIKDYLIKNFGQKYVSQKLRFYKKSKSAQEAHEAIRPTYISNTPEAIKKALTPNQLKLYTLIFNRTLASQMADARYSQISAKITAGAYLFRTGGRSLLFDGFMKVYLEKTDEETKDAKFSNLENLKKDNVLSLIKAILEQKFTQPPPRLTEAALIKILEENGIGRPSTYAPTISTIINRGYVKLEERRFIPMDIGFIVTDMLTENFPFVVNADFTAKIENELDDIALGQMKWQKAVGDFWYPFKDELDKKIDKIEKVEMPVIETDEVCEKCGKKMVIKTGRFGEFLACSGFPECKNAKPIIKKSGIKCPDCEEGEIVERKTRKGRVFWGCERYPDCKYATWKDPAKKQEK
jgi:DNA topoisomerase-1